MDYEGLVESNIDISVPSVSRLTWLNAVLAEALRMYPSFPAMRTPPLGDA